MRTRFRAPRQVGQVVREHAWDPSGTSTRREAVAQAGPSPLVSLGGVAVAGTRLDLRLGLGRLGLRFLHAAPERLTELGEGLRSTPHDDEDEHDDQDDEQGVHARMVQRAVLA